MDGVEWLELCKRSHLDEKKIDGHVDDESDVWRCFLFFGVSIYCNIYCWMSVVDRKCWHRIGKYSVEYYHEGLHCFFLDVPKRPVLNLRGDWRLKEIGLLSPFDCI